MNCFDICKHFISVQLLQFQFTMSSKRKSYHYLDLKLFWVSEINYGFAQIEIFVHSKYVYDVQYVIKSYPNKSGRVP